MKHMRPIYLDYNATTPIDPEVLRAMLPYLKAWFGNPSSSHAYGKPAKEAVSEAREKVAKLVGSDSDEIVFTGGGTESDNHAIIGAAFANMRRGKHIVASRVEHPAVLETLQYLKMRFGFEVTYDGQHLQRRFRRINPKRSSESRGVFAL
jgi:cysteine desulfurase